MKELTLKAREALEHAAAAAQNLSSGQIGTEHILLGLLHSANLASEVLEAHNLTYGAVSEKLKEMKRKEPVVRKEARGYTPGAERVLAGAAEVAAKMKSQQTGTEHILIAILQDADSMGSRMLDLLGVSGTNVYQALLKSIGQDYRSQKLKYTRDKKEGGVLEKYAKDLTEEARAKVFDPIIGRRREINRLIQILSRRTKNNPCLVGGPGVGKTAIVEGLAQRIAAGEVPDNLKKKRLMALNLSSMVAGSKYRGEFEERIRAVLEEVMSSGQIILFIDEIHTMIGAGGAEGSLDAANILKPQLARGNLQVIGATTQEEYRKYFEKDGALERRFQPIHVEEPTEEETIQILRELKPIYEEFHQVSITDEALIDAVRLSVRYISDRLLPDKAIDVLDEAASKTKMGRWELLPETGGREIRKWQAERAEALRQGDLPLVKMLQRKLERKKEGLKQSGDGGYVVDKERIAEVVSDWSGIPVKQLSEEESERLRHLDERLKQKIIGQDEAVEAVSRAIKRGRVGVKDPAKPVGSFMFLGPTGVGKTELSKALAEILFGDKNMLIRVDMSEYMEKHSVAKFIGSPPGYVGHEDGGQLSEKIRQKPYSIILFDEIEKAHPDVFNILLQVLDDGHITDSHGRRVDFKNTIIIMTSNLGAQNLVNQNSLGFQTTENREQDHKAMKKKVMDEVKRLFRPEFINRLDELIVFHSLSEEDIKRIVGLLFEDLAKRLAAARGIFLRLTPTAVSFIAQKGYNKNYGARPIKRAIQEHIEDELANQILEGRIKAGDTVSIRAVKEKLTFTIKQGKEN